LAPGTPFYRTSQVAAAVGVHPNTVRLYEAWGLLPPVPRSPSGYRLFTQAHLDQMRLARLALRWPYPGGKEPVTELVTSAAAGEWSRAVELAHRYLANIHAELAHAKAGVAFLELWAAGGPAETVAHPLLIGEAAEHLGVTADMLRNWDRNGLLDVPRDPQTGYRCYGAAELGRARVIRMLRQANYSVMAILRMLIQFDAGRRAGLAQALDSPRPDEEMYNVADRWLSTLAEQEARAIAVIELLNEIAGRAPSG
jgi:DNA-binding transcriptional MerR regulator